MQPIVFNKAGKFMLRGYEDGIPSMSKVMSRNGVVQQITPNITINGTPVPDGNSMWDAMNLDTGIEGTLAVQLGYMPPELYAFIMGDASEVLQSAVLPVIDKEYIIPESTTYTIDLDYAPITHTVEAVTTADLVIVDIHNEPFEMAAAAAKGKYALSDKKLTFDASDAGKQIFVTYFYTESTAEVLNFGLPKTPVRSAYQLIIVGEAIGEDETLYEVVTTVDKCKVLGAINPPSQGGTPEPMTITFNIQKPRGDLRALDYKAKPIKAVASTTTP